MNVSAAGRDLSALAGGALRPGSDADAIDGVAPEWVVEPPTPEAVAAVLKWCTAQKDPVVIRGGGTHLAWGRRPPRIGVILSTRRLDRIIRYEPGDLTVTVEAGLSIAALNRELATHRQWLPVDTSSDQATIGGAIATNDSGPLRHRYGTPRDQVIGVRLATADGRLASAGGQVVKNVAGYDLSKLVAGSFGALAGIVGATFKLAPIPAAFSTLVVTFRDASSLAVAAAAVGDSQLDPVCLEAEADFGHALGYRLVVRFGGTPTANADQASAAASLAGTSASATGQPLTGAEDAAFWEAWRVRQSATPGVVVRASWLPAQLVEVLTLVERLHRELGVSVAFAGRTAVGSGTFGLDGDVTAQASAIDHLRRAEVLGHVVVTRSGVDVKARADVWGPATSASLLTNALKHALDPSGVLNARRGPL